jgi:hypothetical protein
MLRLINNFENKTKLSTYFNYYEKEFIACIVLINYPVFIRSITTKFSISGGSS